MIYLLFFLQFITLKGEFISLENRIYQWFNRDVIDSTKLKTSYYYYSSDIIGDLSITNFDLAFWFKYTYSPYKQIMIQTNRIVIAMFSNQFLTYDTSELNPLAESVITLNTNNWLLFNFQQEGTSHYIQLTDANLNQQKIQITFLNYPTYFSMFETNIVAFQGWQGQAEQLRLITEVNFMSRDFSNFISLNTLSLRILLFIKFQEKVQTKLLKDWSNYDYEVKLGGSYDIRTSVDDPILELADQSFKFGSSRFLNITNFELPSSFTIELRMSISNQLIANFKLFSLLQKSQPLLVVEYFANQNLKITLGQDSLISQLDMTVTILTIQLFFIKIYDDINGSKLYGKYYQINDQGVVLKQGEMMFSYIDLSQKYVQHLLIGSPLNSIGSEYVKFYEIKVSQGAFFMENSQIQNCKLVVDQRCVVCQTSYQISIDGTCQTSCPTNYVFNSFHNKCIKICHTKCETCTSDPTYCNSCSGNRYPTPTCQCQYGYEDDVSPICKKYLKDISIQVGEFEGTCQEKDNQSKQEFIYTQNFQLSYQTIPKLIYSIIGLYEINPGYNFEITTKYINKESFTIRIDCSQQFQFKIQWMAGLSSNFINSQSIFINQEQQYFNIPQDSSISNQHIICTGWGLTSGSHYTDSYIYSDPTKIFYFNTANHFQYLSYQIFKYSHYQVLEQTARLNFDQDSRYSNYFGTSGIDTTFTIDFPLSIDFIYFLQYYISDPYMRFLTIPTITQDLKLTITRILEGNPSKDWSEYFKVFIFATQCEKGLCDYFQSMIDQCNTNYLNCKQSYFDGSSTALCNNNCYECDSPGDLCLSCSSSEFKVLDAIPQTCNCIDGYFMKLDGYCYQCDSNCKTCQDSPNHCISCSIRKILNAQNQCQDADSCTTMQFLTGGNACADCDPNCQTCQTSSTQCTTCKMNYYLSSTQCPSCNQNCATCDFNPPYCETCQPNSHLIPGPYCICDSGYYQNGSTCQSCSSTCKECNSTPTNCSSCYKNKTVISGICQCSSTQYLDNQDMCQNCDSNCVTCSISATNCTSCLWNQYLDSSHVCQNCDANCRTCLSSSTHCVSCLSNQYLDTSHICQNCNTNCTTCQSSPTNCTSCGTHKYLNNTNQCIECHANCQLCQNNSNNCYVCYDHNYLDTGNMCQNCSGNCNSCQISNSRCTSCYDNFYLNTSYTCSNCNSNCASCSQYSTCTKCSTGSKYIDSNNSCQNCDPNCGTCYHSSTNCSSCHLAIQYLPQYYPSVCSYCDQPPPATPPNSNPICYTYSYCIGSSSNCVPSLFSCSDKYYWTGYYCAQCSTNCYNCRDYSICTSCPYPSQYINPFSNSCENCNSTCTTCQFSADNCTSCQNFYYLVGTTCQQCDYNCAQCQNSPIHCTSCANHYYLTTLNTCAVCDNKCNACQTTPTRCLTCQTHKYLDQFDVCQDCDINCQSCQTAADRCITCSTHQYLDSNDKCQDCNDNCKSCITNSTNCTTCFDHQYLNSNSICICNPGFYYSVTECLPCDPNCQECLTTSTNCTSCKTYEYLNNLNICQSCHLPCNTCQTTSDNCTSCFMHSTLQTITTTGGTTIDSCICNSGFYMTSNYYCSACDKNCVECENESTYCTSCLVFDHQQLNDLNKCECLPGYYMLSNYCFECSNDCFECNNLATYCTSCPAALNQVPIDGICQCLDNQFVDTDQSCQSCDSSCLTCETNATNCLSCYSQTYLLNNQCVQCHASCISCSGALDTDCITCLNYLTKNADSLCVCNMGYYESAPQKCDECLPICKSCENNSQCLECKDGLNRLMDSNNYCSCKIGYYEKVGSLICQKCMDNCVTCIDGNGCSSCDPTQNRILVNDLCECQNQYFLSAITNKCVTCSSKEGMVEDICNYQDCTDKVWTKGEQCDDGNNLSKDGCNDCFTEIYFACWNELLQPSICVRCQENCRLCKFEGTLLECETCMEGYFLQDNRCIQCRDTCKVCESFAQCTTCLIESLKPLESGSCPLCEEIPGLYTVGQQCLSKCGDGIVYEGSEQCDDGNTMNDDGCDSNCQKEKYFICEGKSCTRIYPPKPIINAIQQENNKINERNFSLYYEPKLRSNISPTKHMSFKINNKQLNSDYQISVTVEEGYDFLLGIFIKLSASLQDNYLQIHFTQLEEIIGKNGLCQELEDLEIKIEDYYYVSDIAKETIETTALVSNLMLYIFIIFVIFAIIFGGLDAFWNLLDMIQILSYVKLINTDFPFNFSTYLETFEFGNLSFLTNLLKIQDLIENLIDEEELSSYKPQGILGQQADSGLFIINILSTISTVVLVFVLYIISTILIHILPTIMKIVFKELRKKYTLLRKVFKVYKAVLRYFQKYQKQFFWNVLIRTHMSTAYDMTFAIILQFQFDYSDMKSPIAQSSYIICCVASVLQISSILFYITKIGVTRAEFIKTSFQNNYGEAIFDSLQVKQLGTIRTYYNVFLFIKRHAHILILISLGSVPSIQTISVGILGILNMSFLFMFNPLELKAEFIKQLLSEGLLYVMTMLIFVLTIDDQLSFLKLPGRVLIGWVLVGDISFILFTQFIIDIYLQGRIFSGFIKQVAQLPTFQQIQSKNQTTYI